MTGDSAGRESVGRGVSMIEPIGSLRGSIRRELRGVCLRDVGWRTVWIGGLVVVALGWDSSRVGRVRRLIGALIVVAW
jgi:hypothetical protein